MIRKRGPGTIIKETLAAWGISEHTGCNCNSIAEEMDRDGPQIVQQRMNYYVDEISTSSRTWRKGLHIASIHIPTLQPPKFIIKELIEYAITTSFAERSLN